MPEVSTSAAAPDAGRLRVRPARPEELAAAGELCVAAYRAGGHLADGDPYEATLIDAAGRAATAEVLVAELDGELVGTVTICPAGSPYAEVGRPGESEFRFLAVSPRAWGRGIGPALVDACEERAIARGQSAHVICVIDINEAAHRMYQRLGFTRLPERDWEPVPGVRLWAYRRAVPHVAEQVDSI